MAACSSLDRIFDKPLPENQTFLESISPWKHKHLKPEIFDELHFKENNHPPASPPHFPLSPVRPGPDAPDMIPNPSIHSQKKQYKHRESFSSMKSESLSLCTEGLGFESFDDAEDRNSHVGNKGKNVRVSENHYHRMDQFCKRSRICRSEFPPPISCIGSSGCGVCFKSYRQDGRFILKEIRIPTQEFLHAYREDGRLRLQFISSDDDEIGENLIEN